MIGASPSSDYLVKQFAKVLKHPDVTVDLLTALAGVLARGRIASWCRRQRRDQVENAYRRLPQGAEEIDGAVRSRHTDTVSANGRTTSRVSSTASFERLAVAFLKEKYGEAAIPVRDRGPQDLHRRAGPQPRPIRRPVGLGAGVEGVTVFRPGMGKPKVAISTHCRTTRTGCA